MTHDKYKMLQLARCFKSIKNQLNFRGLSSNVSIKETVKYTDTINLPKTKFPQRLSATKRIDVERKINEDCFKQLYQWQRKNLETSEFALHDGPPYANGELHMGHAVNKILKDIVLRENIINGKRVHYIPGWDCHGLPIELKAMEKYKEKSQPLVIRQKARKFALETLEKQKAEFASWGITADWNDPKSLYRTFDPSYIQNQLNIFYALYERDLVYRDLKPVFWSPSSKTALAEAELEYDVRKSPSLTLRVKMLKYPNKITTSENVYALIWTTTPWSIPSNQAICFRSDSEYCAAKLSGKDGLYVMAKSVVDTIPNVEEVLVCFPGSELSDCSYFHPINTKDVMSLYPANHVQSTKGTGLVHTAPAHGADDFLISLEHKLPVICFVDEHGNYTIDAPEFLRHKSVFADGNDLVINHLTEDIIESSTILHKYPIDWRTKEPVIIRTSEQWFINTERIKDSALEEISKVNMYPQSSVEANRNNFTNQLKNRPYWCISRQRVWGTPIPAFYSKDSGKSIINKDIIEHICSLIEAEGNVDFWWSKSVVEIIPKQIWDKYNINVDDVVKGEDILDIWFDSGISWAHALNPPKIADLCLEGIDQFTGWFQSSLMTSVALRGHGPYKSLFVHGFTVDQNSQKMSKSLGNIIRPKDITDQYGTDTLRWWIAAHSTQHMSIPVSHAKLQQAADTVQKIRGILKFLVGSLEAERSESSLNFETKDLLVLDKIFLNSLVEFEKEVTSLYESYQYNKVTATILNFVTNQLSGIYLHTIKDRFYCGTEEEHSNVKNVLRSAFYVLNKVLWPITPFLVEECWSYHDKHPFYQFKVEVPAHWNEPKYKELWDVCSDCKEILHQTVHYVNTWKLDVSIAASLPNIIRLHQFHLPMMEPDDSSELCEILQVSSITLIPNESNDFITISAQPIERSLCPRCRRFAIDVHQTLCSRCESVLRKKT